MMNRSPGSLDMLATALRARQGAPKDALTLINELRAAPTGEAMFRQARLLTSYLALGDYDQAFFWCDEAYKEQSAILQWLKEPPSSIRAQRPPVR